MSCHETEQIGRLTTAGLPIKKPLTSVPFHQKLASQDCVVCHGADLHGGEPGQLGPVGPSLVMVKDWTLEEFSTTLRTGVDPNGHELDNAVMPWRSFGRMDDDELTALDEYLQAMP